MKKIIISLFIIFLSVSLSPVCFATEDINYYRQQYNLSEADKLDDILDQEIKEELNTLGINLQESNLNLNFNSLLSFIYKKILSLVTTPLKIFAVLLTVIVLNSVVTSINNNESKDILSFISAVKPMLYVHDSIPISINIPIIIFCSFI